MKRAAEKDASTVKRTRRGGVDEEDLTLEQLIAKKRSDLVLKRQQAPELLARAQDLASRAEELAGRRWLKRRAADMLLEAEELRREAQARLGMAREHVFEKRVVAYVRTYYAGSASRAVGTTRRQSCEHSGRSADAANQQRGKIVDEYLHELGAAPPRVVMAPRDVCPRCAGEQRLVLCTEASTLTCRECGYTVAYLDATSASTAFDEVIDFTPYSYKRINHFLQWLSLLQGKEAHVVPRDVLEAVMSDLYSRVRLRRGDAIEQKYVRESLRRLRLRKAYDHVAQITARLSGIRPPRVSPETEERLKTMFLKAQPAFQRHAASSRTNFLSYSYVLYRFFQILGIPHVLTGLTLLKGRDKLENNDRIFRLMCQDLGWVVPDLPPENETTAR